MDEEQISTLRAALHHWIDHATVEQLERMNHVVAVDARRFVPVALLPPRQSKIQSTPQSTGTSYVDRWNAQHERRRRHADWLERRGMLIAMKATPEQITEWDAANPDPLLDESDD